MWFIPLPAQDLLDLLRVSSKLSVTRDLFININMCTLLFSLFSWIHCRSAVTLLYVQEQAQSIWVWTVLWVTWNAFTKLIMYHCLSLSTWVQYHDWHKVAICTGTGTDRSAFPCKNLKLDTNWSVIDKLQLPFLHVSSPAILLGTPLRPVLYIWQSKKI